MLLGSAEPSEAHKVRSKISDAVKRQSEQLVVAFLKAAANNDRNAVDNILEEGAIEVDDSDGALCMHGTWFKSQLHSLLDTNFSSILQVQAAQHCIWLPQMVTLLW